MEEKCGQQLSLALAGKEKRNQALEAVLKFLWLGLVEQALTYLRQLDPNWIKQQEALEQMVKYLERNQGYLPACSGEEAIGLAQCSQPRRKEQRSAGLGAAKTQWHELVEVGISRARSPHGHREKR